MSGSILPYSYRIYKSEAGRSSVEYRLELWTATKDPQKNAAIRGRLLAALQEVRIRTFMTIEWPISC
jgi:hypothetical protein